ncbi:two-component system response regulator [Shewanella fidelis]|uniref:Two-component system response regulator n=1 Tax=Shewanella fidelis TaxID=173509 RepID=A0AAW8NPR1_9GAMM|nr:two-component system response regulator [Shewanella fidelis]MDR8525173.1 two-component system response regulator [Shewanella fidelis]MDW4811244.1 two-component system response regulator [Shewanella fidelis]MDW4814977.1 two-component system response regulator [Shewanella fidelis]MDW4819067.1 two-component system response regulator [Shewanella fidelis]MDW4823256.1 two-component system response regulator [Shewanella fidelis]
MDKATVLVVDDTPENIDILVGILAQDYKVKVAIDGPRALALAAKTVPDLILLDVMMPGMNGYEVCKRLKQDPLTSHIPVIFVTALTDVADETQGFELGAVDYITKPVSAPVVKARVKTHLALYDQKRLLEQEVKVRTKELEDTRFEIIRRLGRAAEYKDNETGLHVIRMSHYARLLAVESGLPDKYCELIYNAAPMHDIGKIGTPDAILKKPDKLNEQEWLEMQRHAEIGAEIIGEHNDPLLEMARRIALTHHEKWDGTGYPNGLSGEEIPIEGRIVAIADVFDALTSIRPYKQAWSVAETMDLFERESGKHFDPELVVHFKQVIDEAIKIRDSYNETA